jgi:hypothetical protein
MQGHTLINPPASTRREGIRSNRLVGSRAEHHDDVPSFLLDESRWKWSFSNIEDFIGYLVIAPWLGRELINSRRRCFLEVAVIPRFFVCARGRSRSCCCWPVTRNLALSE